MFSPVDDNADLSRRAEEMGKLLQRLFPLCRSLTGNGVRRTLRILQEKLPTLKISEVASGARAFDWTVPDEWNVEYARLTDPNGCVVADFAENNLHLVGYSEPVNRFLPLDALQAHLHSRPDLPDAIPYVTSYYQKNWGFCLSHRTRERLEAGMYHAEIRTTLQQGHMTYGELHIPGELKKEILLSTYICHPSLANDNLSGPVVAVELAKWLLSRPRRYSYRIVFVPETIGSIVYLSRHLDVLKQNVVAGFVLTCLGDERAYSYLPSRLGDTLADEVALHVLLNHAPDFIRYSYLERGSDERQYCSPGVDLPVCSVMRSKYNTFPEYHTSLDDTAFVTEDGLRGGFAVLRKCIEALEFNKVYRSPVLCEVQMGRRNLYPAVSRVGGYDGKVRDMQNLLAYADGESTLLKIAEKIGIDIFTCAGIAMELEKAGVLFEASRDN